MEIELLKDHLDGGALKSTGETLELTEKLALWLIGAGVAKQTTAAIENYNTTEGDLNVEH